jgi:hypothetical protein
MAHGRPWLLLPGVLAVSVACGQKGPPLPPLHLVPNAPAAASVARVGDEARLQFTVPTANLNGPGAVDIDRVEIYAATVAAGAAPPPNRELLSTKFRVGSIGVKPPPADDETPPANAPPDPRPAAGEKAKFVEKLTPETQKPVFTTPAPKAAISPVPARTGTASATAAAPSSTATQAMTELPGVPIPVPTVPDAPAPEPPPAYPVRVYAIRGISKSGRPGQPAQRLQLPLVDPPASPVALLAGQTETAVTLAWTASESGSPVTFNVYKVGGADPINSAPVSASQYERQGVEFGTEECFAVRAVRKVGNVDTESDLSEPACITPRDTYPPKAPQHLAAVAATGVVSLSWDANSEPDLAGYLVLRGEAPGDTLQPLTPAPITATNYEDKTVTPGVRYAYAIVAVDKAAPPNRSAESARVEETAR